MKIYDNGFNRHTEYKEVLFKFCYVYFILIIGIIALEQRYFVESTPNTKEDIQCVTSDVKYAEGCIGSIQIETLEYNEVYVRPRDPLTGNKIVYYGE